MAFIGQVCEAKFSRVNDSLSPPSLATNPDESRSSKNGVAGASCRPRQAPLQGTSSLESNMLWTLLFPENRLCSGLSTLHISFTRKRADLLITDSLFLQCLDLHYFTTTRRL